jgi:predicted glycosyltransferase
MSALIQKRVLLFVHDGGGLGHLQRLARIAASLQGRCASLLVTGMREAGLLLDPRCEFVHLPSWDSVRPGRSALYGRQPWLTIPKEGAIRLRQELLASVVASFQPDSLVVDYLPFGQWDELRQIVEQFAGRKYFILRGLIDTSDRHRLHGASADVLAAHFDRIFVAADQRVVDVAQEYGFSPLVQAKLSYVGYITPSHPNRELVRRKFRVPSGRRWVVCSAGGGVRAEAFLQRCVSIATHFPEANFLVILGPRSNAAPEDMAGISPNCEVISETPVLPQVHASCDILVTSGGYNSLVEAMMGGASILVRPNNAGEDDEQRNAAVRIGLYYPVQMIEETALETELRKVLAEVEGRPRPEFPFFSDGAKRIRSVIFKDLRLEADE